MQSKMANSAVTVDQCKSWEKSGKNEFMKLCRGYVTAINDHGMMTEHAEGLRNAIYELTWHRLMGHITQEQIVKVLAAVAEMHDGIPSLMADTLSVIDTESISLESDKSVRESFLALLSGCVAITGSSLLKERLDYETMEAIKVIPNKLAFSQKYVRLKTKLFYKQQKFNLLREESEGYAKVVTEMLQVVDNTSSSATALQGIKSLIGCFDLDPNRVLDIILEAFECAPHLDKFYVSLLQSYMYEPITLCHIIGFKFQFYKEEEVATPESLYRVVALLMQHGLLQLDDLYVHLAPDDASINQKSKMEIRAARTYARNMSMVILSDKTDKDDEDKEKIQKIIDNQKLGLCEGLLNQGDWEHAKQLIDKLPSHSAVSSPSVAKALCSLVTKLIDPLYRKYAQPSGSRSRRLSPLTNSFAMKPPTKLCDLGPVLQMTTVLGPYASIEPVLLWKLIRLGKCIMKEKNSTKGGVRTDMEDVFRRLLSTTELVLLPSLSMMENNACFSEAMWSLIKAFPYQMRYSLYGRWKNHVYGQYAPLIRIKANALDKSKYIMKRLTKENVKQMGRQIGKLSHANPAILFDYLLSQIQKYDNFILPVVDSLKYLTSLSYDVLAYCVVEALANPEKERMKHDDTELSMWLQGLASFCGAVFRKYNIELTGLLQYVANQLKAGKSFDLLIMREIIQKMSGIEVTELMTVDQLDALAGGELLRAEGGYFSQVRNTKKSSQRLKEALLDHNLAISLCMLMSQERFNIVFKHEENTHLKLVGKLYDQCQDTLVQLGGFLANLLNMDDYAKHLPTLDKLVLEYQLTPDVAFFLHRPMCFHAITSKYDELRKQDKLDKSSKSSSSTQQKIKRYCEAVEIVIPPIVEKVKALQSPKVWDEISPQFYVTFWTLSMYDLHVPSTSYTKEMNKIDASILALEDNKDLVSAKKRKEKERFNIIKDKLRDEEKKQQEHCARVEARLKQECNTWFTQRSTKNETITQFLQHCIFPRCCFTASDALYCAKFVLTVHQLKTPNFSTLLCYDRVFQDITYTVASCTENEASRYGRFLCAMLETVIRWHGDKAIYEKECSNYPGFVTVVRASGTDSSNKADQLDYENFRHVCHKWQYKLTKALVACLESKEYTQIRNTLILLTKILPYFPLVQNLGNVLEKRVDKIRAEEKDKRPDIFALAMGYSGQLKQRKPHMLPEDKFHLREAKPTAGIVNGLSNGAPVKKTPAVNAAEKVTTVQENGAVGGGEHEGTTKSISAKERDTSTPDKTSTSASTKSRSTSSPVHGKRESKSEGKDRSSSSKEEKSSSKEEKKESSSSESKKEKSSKEGKSHKSHHKDRETKHKEDKGHKGEQEKQGSKVKDYKSGKGHRNEDLDDLKQSAIAGGDDGGGEDREKGKDDGGSSGGVEADAAAHRLMAKHTGESEVKGHTVRIERSSSVAAASSSTNQGFVTPSLSSSSSSRNASPSKERSSDRDHKRRKMEHSSSDGMLGEMKEPSSSSSSSKSRSKSQDKERKKERSSSRDRLERSRSMEKERKSSDKKRDHSEGEPQDVKRRKEDADTHSHRSSSSPIRTPKEDRKSKSSKSSGDAALNGERISKKEKREERKDKKEAKEDSKEQRKESRDERRESREMKEERRESREIGGRERDGGDGSKKSKRESKESSRDEDRHRKQKSR